MGTESNGGGGNLQPITKDHSKPPAVEAHPLDPGHRENGALAEEGSSVTVSSSVAYVGPIPPPGVLKGYKDIDPTLVDDIMRRWGAEQDHRHMQERKLLEAQVRLASSGQRVAGLLGMSAIAGAPS